MEAELNIRAPSLDPNLPDDRERSVPHHLILLVRQSLRGSDRNRVPGMNPHGIQILNRANNHAIVRVIPHDLHFKFLPPEQAFLNQHLAHRG